MLHLGAHLGNSVVRYLMQLILFKLSVRLLVSLINPHLFSIIKVYFSTGAVSITSFGSLTAGESYSLECFAGGTTAIFEWLGPPDSRTPVVNSSSITTSSNSSTSQLQFRPLRQSHNGSYSCRVSTDEDTLLSEPVKISVIGI